MYHVFKHFSDTRGPQKPGPLLSGAASSAISFLLCILAYLLLPECLKVEWGAVHLAARPLLWDQLQESGCRSTLKIRPQGFL